jgi:Fe2+ or Zn2+ uptake regulation protein
MAIDSAYQYVTPPYSPDDLMALLVQAGHSNTRARRAVIAALCESAGQATPAQLLTLGRIHQPTLGLITVYRTLEVLSELGLIRKLHLDEGCSTYAFSVGAARPAADAHDHPHDPTHAHGHSHHIICQRCRRAAEFAGCDIDQVIASAERQTGYRVREHWLEMFGLCPECQADDAG